MQSLCRCRCRGPDTVRGEVSEGGDGDCWQTILQGTTWHNTTRRANPQTQWRHNTNRRIYSSSKKYQITRQSNSHSHSPTASSSAVSRACFQARRVITGAMRRDTASSTTLAISELRHCRTLSFIMQINIKYKKSSSSSSSSVKSAVCFECYDGLRYLEGWKAALVLTWYWYWS